ncbi:N-acetyltransferase [Luteolibacter flavescens]|uniref:N-acetyltransferase n=1 Tax=Luteolibacter flavescens TaxID=1859460 RepID=A0ABT3FKP6_9BACT|nr:GNAT family N-acetyltransferase [Luteolibacter flavescens]MCW1883570.1 N-acetyltransferase [Luteolibacter flavescens]
MSEVIDQTGRGRFELEEEGALAFAAYRREGNLLIIPHVEADPALRGRGTAGRLMAGMLEIIRARGEKVRPICGYAVAWIGRHPEYRDLVE